MNYPKTFSDKKYPDFIQKSIFLKAYPKPVKVFPRIGLKNCEVLLSAKNKKSIGYKGKGKLKICFSSDGNKGYWDIATMSMRGIKSCMRWESNRSKSLIGSILDPYAGIIYITDGSDTKYGKKIIARAVVRFIAHFRTNKPAIFIEQIYAQSRITNNGEAYFNLEKIFKSFIEKQTKLKVISFDTDIEGILNDHDDYECYNIPKSEIVDSIQETEGIFADNSFLSYRDSGMDYTKIKKFYDPMKVKV